MKATEISYTRLFSRSNFENERLEIRATLDKDDKSVAEAFKKLQRTMLETKWALEKNEGAILENKNEEEAKRFKLKLLEAKRKEIERLEKELED